MTRVALALLMLVVADRSVDAADVPRMNLDNAPPPVVAMMSEAADAVEASPDSADAWGEYAIVLHAHACKPEADIAYAEAQRLAPFEFRWAYFRGVLLLKVDPSKALEYLDLAVGLDGAYGPAYIRRGLALEAVGRDDDARRDYREAIRLEPANVSAHVHLGQLELKFNDIDAAIRHLEKARVARPDDAAVLSSLARAYSRKGDRTRARELADAARNTRAGRVVDDRRFNEVAMKAVTLQSFIDRANVYFKASRSDTALAELQTALSHYPNAGPVHVALADLYFSRREYAKCVVSSRIALASGHQSASLNIVLGAGLFHLRQFDEADDAVGRALEAAPSDPTAMRLHGRIAAARGDDAEAVERWSRALAVDDDAAIRRERAKARSRLGQHDEAATELRALLLTAPNEPATWLALGEVHRGAGDLDAALTAFDRAAENASVPFAGRQAASVLMAQRRFAEAQMRLRDLRKRWPCNTNLMNDLAWLLSTCPDENVRNGAKALTVIRPLVQQTRRKEPAVLDTFAAALAEVGRFSEATAAMDEVLALLPDNTPAERRAGYQMRRDHYAGEKAWRNDS